MRLSIIIPVFNEVALVTTLLEKVVALELDDGMAKEIVIVDDGSTDGTLEVLHAFHTAHPETRLLVHEKNSGKGAAVRTGMQAAQGDIFIIQDADLEYDPEDIREVVRPVVTGQASVVYGSRILREKALGRSGVLGLVTGKHPHSYVLAYLGGVTITQWINLITGACLTDEPTCYKSFRRAALEGIEIDSDDFAWEPEITVKLLLRGIEIREVPIAYHPRKNRDGKKINWRDGVKALWTAGKYRFRKSS
ncbi:glycosyltransferase family 2 protein [Luteolibacter soli]|uniref:Glycosyltransferase family 2 protein n=1 Tax=Luteolibacter soli TaxID=3135280 RepID=A0ABU9AT00_9BACT